MLCRNRSIPRADSKEGGEAKSRSSCFSRGGDDHGFSVTHLPWHVLVGSSARQCWCQDTVGRGSARHFHLERTHLCQQWQKNPPGIQEGRRPGLEMASLQSCDPNALLLPVTGQTWQCHLAACCGDTTLLRGWHIPTGSNEIPALRGGQHRAQCLTQMLRAASHSALPAGPTVKGRLLQQSQVIGPQAQAAPPDCATSTRSSSLHPCPPTCPL